MSCLPTPIICVVIGEVVPAARSASASAIALPCYSSHIIP